DVRARAARTPRRIVFPESADERTLAAVSDLAERRIVDPILILDPARPETHAAVRAVGVPVRDPSDDEFTTLAIERLIESRGRKGLTKEGAIALVHTPLFFADSLVAAGQADGCVAGAVHTTGDVLRAALWTVGKFEGVQTVSSAFYMVVPPFRSSDAE